MDVLGLRRRFDRPAVSYLLPKGPTSTVALGRLRRLALSCCYVTIAGAVRDTLVSGRRGRWKTLCARGARRPLPRGRSTSSLGGIAGERQWHHRARQCRFALALRTVRRCDSPALCTQRGVSGSVSKSSQVLVTG